MSNMTFLRLKFPSAIFSCHKENDQVIFDQWSCLEHPDIPTSQELDSWIAIYESEKISENNNKKGRKRQLLDALATLTGLTRKQVLKCFVEIVQDGNDD